MSRPPRRTVAAVTRKNPEREHFAYELHDGVCQELVGISMLLAPLVGSARRVAPALACDLEQVAERVSHTLTLVRNLALEWAQGTTAPRGDLETTLRAEIAHLRRDHRVTVSVDVPARHTLDIDSATSCEIGKIVREAMRNAVRHGRARTIEIRCRGRAGDWQLEISDDGTGLGADRQRRAGLGLRSMRYRATRLGGTCEVTARARRGTRVLVSWPRFRESRMRSRRRPPNQPGRRAPYAAKREST